jgi:sulfur transfer protein SufE
MALKETAIDEIIENFALLDEWDDRYRYLLRKPGLAFNLGEARWRGWPCAEFRR